MKHKPPALLAVAEKVLASDVPQKGAIQAMRKPKGSDVPRLLKAIAEADADELVAIKRGEWPLEKTVREAERLFAKAEEAYERSVLPERPDAQETEEICMSVIRSLRLGA